MENSNKLVILAFSELPDESWKERSRRSAESRLRERIASCIETDEEVRLGKQGCCGNEAYG